MRATAIWRSFSHTAFSATSTTQSMSVWPCM